MDAQQAIKEIVGILGDCIRDAGPEGIPEGHLYAQLMGYGCTLDQFQGLMGVLCSTGKFKRSNHVIRAL